MTDGAELLLAYYGDDFTGSTDALEALSRAGLRTMLFLEPPAKEELVKFPGLQAMGMAGLTRSLAPAAMERELRPAFAALRALRPRHVHYKVCSTFDSSPTVGSIGRALEIGAEVFETKCVPLLVGAPALGRYCVFGNLFARMGIGSAGEIHRLDRHPAMSCHPVTPADESDLRRHLARQTDRRVALFDVLKLELPVQQARAALQEIVDANAVLFDVLYPHHHVALGRLIESMSRDASPLFSIGSSAVESALAAHWQALGRVTARRDWPEKSDQGPLLVLSGSCSPVTAGQIASAEEKGFALVELKLPAATGLRSRVVDALRSGRSTVVFTSRGQAGAALPAAGVGEALGTIAREAVERAGVRHIVVAGGDTSSYAARTMGIRAVEMIAPFAPGAPWCRAHAPGSPLDGVTVNFKGGQVGAADYFGRAAEMTL